MGILVGSLVDLAVAEALVAVDQKIPLTETIHLGFEAIRQGEVLRGFDTAGRR
ncbi:hypothetical protein D3C78_1935440 [compost metagenome]